MKAILVMDNLGYLNVILFKEGKFETPLAVINYTNWEQLKIDVNMQFKDLAPFVQNIEKRN